MEAYDSAFAPVGECGECLWKDWCRPILEQGSGDVSLVPYMTGKTRDHLDHGTTDRAACPGSTTAPRH